MMYSYKCNVCGARFDGTSRFLNQCPECLNREVRRDYSTVQIGVRAFKPHFNHAVGSYVSTSKEFDQLLRLKAEQAQSTYTRLDPGDTPTPTVDTQIFDDQMKTITDRGINPSTLVE